MTEKIELVITIKDFDKIQMLAETIHELLEMIPDWNYIEKQELQERALKQLKDLIELM